MLIFNFTICFSLGLTLSVASCGYDVTTVCSNQERSENNAGNANAGAFSPDTSFDDHDVMQKIAESSHMTSTQHHDVSLDDANVAMTTNNIDVLAQFKSNSLPMYFSRRCKLCNKPQTNKAHLPKYPHVPNMSQYCMCGVQNNAPPSRAAHQPPNCHMLNNSYNHPVKPPPDGPTDDPINSSYPRDKVDALEYKQKRQVCVRDITFNWHVKICSFKCAQAQ